MLYITPTLYSSYFYYINGISEEEDFLRVLNKEYSPPTPLIQAGIDFEKEVKSINNNEIVSDNPISCKVASITAGGLWQVSCAKELRGFMLYGKADVVKQDHIYDVKFCKSYSIGKYKNSIQHLVYMYCLDIPFFEYLINVKNKSFYKEFYSKDKLTEIVLTDAVYDLVNFIKLNPRFRKIFKEKWIWNNNKTNDF